MPDDAKKAADTAGENKAAKNLKIIEGTSELRAEFADNVTKKDFAPQVWKQIEYYLEFSYGDIDEDSKTFYFPSKKDRDFFVRKANEVNLEASSVAAVLTVTR